MANDPYGFSDDAAGTSASVDRLLTYAVLSCVCAAIGMCACYVPFFIGAPMGLYAAWQAYKAMPLLRDERDRKFAGSTMLAGAVGGLVSSAYAALVLAYVLFLGVYFVFIFGLIGVGALSGVH